MKPLYALHKSADDAILNAGFFDYSFKLNEWLRALDIRAGDRVEFGEALQREVEDAPALEAVA